MSFPSLPALVAFCLVSMLAAPLTSAASKDLGNGFIDHGVAAPISNHRGTVGTVDGNGRNVLLSLLMDHRGGYELLLLDAATGKAEQFPMPFTNELGDSPYASLLSTGNRFYTHFANYFVEFDPAQRAFTFCKRTTPQMAMGMTEDDNGLVWSVTYPQSGVVSFNPKTREFHDYGHVYEQNWPQYQRYVAADDTGVIYFGLGSTASQIVAFDPATAKATPMLPEAQRKKGIAFLYRDVDGKVYGQPLKGDDENWYEFHKGVGRKIGKHPTINRKACITGDQNLFKTDFPDGSRIKTFSLVDRKLAVEDTSTKNVREWSFDYTSEGAIIMGAAASPDGTICGGTAFPMRFFRFDPKSDELMNRAAHGQWNTVTRQGDHFFAGGYPGGFLLDLDPARPWVPTDKKNSDSNPALVIPNCDPTIHRPHALLAHPDGKTIIMGGTPEYGYTGGGLCFWDRQTRSRTLLTDEQVIADQSTMSLVALPEGKLLGGTTTSAGTGGEKKATEAQLYVMDFASKELDWHATVIPGVQNFLALHPGPKGLIYGIADRNLFFVFDPATRKIVHQRNFGADLGKTASQQGPRIFIAGPEQQTFLLLSKGIALIEPATHEIKLLATSPISIEAGGDWLDGRIYFVSGSHLYSYRLK